MASPRSSCIEHPKRSRYITIWDHYLHLFDQSYPAAALLASLELLCNWEMDKLPDEESDANPWFIADMAEVSRSMLGMYSSRTIQESMKRIVDSGLVIVDRRRLGKPNRYLFRYERVQLALRKRWIFDGNFAVEEWVEKDALDGSYDGSTDGNFADGSSAHTFITNEEEKEKEIIQQKPSLPEPLSKPQGDSCPSLESDRTHLYEDRDSERFENISLENLIEWLYIMFAEMKLRPPSPPSTKHQRAMVGRISDKGKEKVVQEIADWFEAGNKSLDKLISSWGSSFSQRREAGMGAHSGGRSIVGRSGGYSGQACPSSFKEQRQYSAEKPEPPLEAKMWNERVGSRKWEFWGVSLHQALQERLVDSDFVKCYERMLDKCAAIAEVNHKRGEHVTFTWLLKDDNWIRLINGQYDYALKFDRSKRTEVDTSMDEVIRNAEKEKI